jgi:hypothetical protein
MCDQDNYDNETGIKKKYTTTNRKQWENVKAIVERRERLQ